MSLQFIPHSCCCCNPPVVRLQPKAGGPDLLSQWAAKKAETETALKMLATYKDLGDLEQEVGTGGGGYGYGDGRGLLWGRVCWMRLCHDGGRPGTTCQAVACSNRGLAVGWADRWRGNVPHTGQLW